MHLLKIATRIGSLDVITNYTTDQIEQEMDKRDDSPVLIRGIDTEHMPVILKVMDRKEVVGYYIYHVGANDLAAIRGRPQ